MNELEESEYLSHSINKYFTEIGNRYFQWPDLNISIYDLPIIFEPRAQYQRNFDFSASLHLKRARMGIKEVIDNGLSYHNEIDQCIPYALQLMSNNKNTYMFNSDKGKNC